MEQYIGRFLDNRYELLEVIGTGGMAVVYKARCHRLNRLVAVKILKSDLAQDEEFRRRFHDESKAVAMLSHPNIVAVYDVSRSSDLEYIVMELIDGITLKQYMQKKGGPLNWREALHFITQIMRALSHAHSRGIIHRDIKPHNMMVLRDGSVKVADFGIARLTSSAQSTLTQEALGSVHYISPEQARGSHIDARSDIYSAGVVLYEMTTGRLPFEGESPVSVAIQHISSVPLSPRELNPEIPEALEAITQKAMATNMDQRYVSADAMLADLEEFRKNPSINFDYTTADLLEGGNDEPTRKVPAAEVIAGVAREEARTRAKNRQTRQEDDYDDRPPRNGPVPILLAIGAILVFIVGIGYFLWVTFFSGLFTPNQGYEVPKLEGKSIEEIETKYPELIEHFVLKEGEVVENTLYDAGIIVSQEPQAGKKVKESGTTIVVDISAGQDEVTMPETYNMEQRLALDLLENRMRLVVHQEYRNSENVTKGYVISSTPVAGTVLLPQDEVTLVISQGPKTKTAVIPVFVGMELEKAKEQLAVLGINLKAVEVVESDKTPGTIVGQSIDPNTEVDEGSSIDFKVSKAPLDPGAPSPPVSPEVPEISDAPPTSPTPTLPPTPTTTQTPASPPVTAAPMSTKAVKVDLPDREGTFQVAITVGGVEKWTNTVDRSIGSSITPRVSGSGVQEVCVYIDGTLTRQFDEDFSN